MSSSDGFYPANPLLLVDDDGAFLHTANLVLRSAGITNVELLSDSREVLARLAQKNYGVVVLDVCMPYVSGSKLLPQICDTHPDVLVVMLTGLNDVDTAEGQEFSFSFAEKPLPQNGAPKALNHSYAPAMVE